MSLVQISVSIVLPMIKLFPPIGKLSAITLLLFADLATDLSVGRIDDSNCLTSSKNLQQCTINV